MRKNFLNTLFFVSAEKRKQDLFRKNQHQRLLQVKKINKISVILLKFFSFVNYRLPSGGHIRVTPNGSNPPHHLGD